MYMKYLEKKCLSRTKKFFEIFERYPRIPHFWTFGPFLDILSKSIQTETQPIWKPILQSTQHKRNQLATAKHVDTVSLQSQKIRSIQNSVPYLYTYARARVSNNVRPVFEKKIFSKFLFYSTSFRKREILKKLSQLVEAAPTVENFSKSRLDLGKSTKKRARKLKNKKSLNNHNFRTKKVFCNNLATIRLALMRGIRICHKISG